MVKKTDLAKRPRPLLAHVQNTLPISASDFAKQTPTQDPITLTKTETE